MSNSLRREVLGGFKQLHRTRLKILNGDNYALNAARNKINDEYKKCKHVTDEMAIIELVKLAKDVDNELKTVVIQAVEVKPGVFEAKITKDTLKMENVPFNDTEILAK